VKTFAAFRYELNVRETISDKSINFSVVGLSTPRLNLPASGPASFSHEYDDLSGTYLLSVEGLDGTISTAQVRIGPKQVKVLKPAGGRPLEIITDERLWPST